MQVPLCDSAQQKLAVQAVNRLVAGHVAELTRYAVQNGLVDICGNPGTSQSVQVLASQVEAAHAEYIPAMEARRISLAERGDMEITSRMAGPALRGVVRWRWRRTRNAIARYWRSRLF